jgi:hypothetical protein
MKIKKKYSLVDFSKKVGVDDKCTIPHALWICTILYIVGLWLPKT